MQEELRSQKNDNRYVLYEDRIEVVSRSRTVTLPLPVDKDRYMNYLCFTGIFYIGDKLYATVATRESYDLKFVIDEDSIELTDPTPFY